MELQVVMQHLCFFVTSILLSSAILFSSNKSLTHKGLIYITHINLLIIKKIGGGGGISFMIILFFLSMELSVSLLCLSFLSSPHDRETKFYFWKCVAHCVLFWMVFVNSEFAVCSKIHATLHYPIPHLSFRSYAHLSLFLFLHSLDNTDSTCIGILNRSWPRSIL